MNNARYGVRIYDLTISASAAIHLYSIPYEVICHPYFRTRLSHLGCRVQSPVGLRSLRSVASARHPRSV